MIQLFKDSLENLNDGRKSSRPESKVMINQLKKIIKIITVNGNLM